jgi:hypothetical protein
VPLPPELSAAPAGATAKVVGVVVVVVVVVGAAGVGTSSNAPASHASPCGRVTPRASVAGGGQPVVTTSRAGLVAESAIVGTSVAGAFNVSASSTGSDLVTSFAASKTHAPAVVLNKRLNPPSMIGMVVSQAEPVLFDRIVDPTVVAGAFGETNMPAPTVAVFPSIVDDLIVAVLGLGELPWDEITIPPPPFATAAVLPLTVTFVSVVLVSTSTIQPPTNPPGRRYARSIRREVQATAWRNWVQRPRSTNP